MRNKNAENMDTTLAYSGALPLYSFPCFIPFLSHAVPDTELQEGIIWSYLHHWLYGVGSSKSHRTGQNVTAFGPRSL